MTKYRSFSFKLVIIGLVLILPIVSVRVKSASGFSGTIGSLAWSYTTGDWVDSSPALGDVDGDGQIEVVVGS
ncbi:MAG: hypothetical protein ACTSU2_06205, partial [Promethearchaeota archaeon]